MKNINKRIVGQCSLCGGIVTVPTYFMSVVAPVPTCEACGAVEDVTSLLPVVPMKPRNPGAENWERRKQLDGNLAKPLTSDIVYTPKQTGDWPGEW